MTLRDLIEELTDLADEHGGDVEVRLAHQPSWPFEYSIGEVVAIDGDEDEEAVDEDGYERDLEHDKPQPPVVYIGERSQLGYLPGAATRALGWRA